MMEPSNTINAIRIATCILYVLFLFVIFITPRQEKNVRMVVPEPSLPELIVPRFSKREFIKSFLLNISKPIRNIIKNEKKIDAVISQSSFVSKNKNGVSDHLSCNINLLDISKDRLDKLAETYASVLLASKTTYPNLFRYAAETEFVIDAHLGYRYYQSSEWAPKFNGKRLSSRLFDFSYSFFFINILSYRLGVSKSAWPRPSLTLPTGVEIWVCKR